jgi:hypothetical protein
MTVESYSKRPGAVVLPASRLRRGFLCLVVLALSFGLTSVAAGQTASEIRAILSDTVGESDVYPVGDAVDVYRAVLDLLYVDGKDHPRVIVLVDSAGRLAHGPCPFAACKTPWPHKSKMDTAVVRAFARQSGKRPRIIDFDYRFPIKRLSASSFERLTQDGAAQLVDRKPGEIGGQATFWAGFRHAYPGAWGYSVLSKVAFNSQHTEALMSVYQNCGEVCNSNEVIYLRRQGKEWRAIERIAESVLVVETGGGLRYRGPAVVNPGDSQLLASDSSGDKPRTEFDDAAKVYTAVLDKLYSFYGETPQQIVLMENHARGFWLPKLRSRIDSSTVLSFNSYASISDAMSRIKYRLPVAWINDQTLVQLERDGAPVINLVEGDPEEDHSPLWYEFHARYPGAWGYASLGRVAFNAAHTQALVFTRHNCGSNCKNGETWFLERKNDNWYVVERVITDQGGNLPIDGLRNLGPDIDSTTYRERKIHGTLIDYETRQPLANTKLQLKWFGLLSPTQSDAAGQYSAGNLHVGPLQIWVECPARLGGKWIPTQPLYVRRGLDSTMNVQVDFATCPQDQ